MMITGSVFRVRYFTDPDTSQHPNTRSDIFIQHLDPDSGSNPDIISEISGIPVFIARDYWQRI